MKKLLTLLPVLAALISCTVPNQPAIQTTAAPANSAANYDQDMAQMMAVSFVTRGIASVDRLKQDLTNIECSKGTEPNAQLTEAIEKANLATIKPPSDGKYLGDFKAGEAVAQSGRGNTWTDSATAVNGGNCYNCHQISKTELSYGSLGPSLYNYGKLRGNSQAIVDYTWGKLNNAKAYNACSGMPRFGHSGILTEKQIKDVMALLLDPTSPVNQ